MTTATKSTTDRQPHTVVDAKAAQPIAKRLQRVLRRIKQVIAVRGFLGTAAVAFAVLLAVMGIDLIVVIESAALRATISLTGVVVVVLAAWWLLVRPLRRRLSLTTVARMVEEHHPELQERVSSALELLAAKSDRGSRGSEQLIAALAAEAVVDVRTFDPRREVGVRTVRPYLVAACTLAVVFVATVLFWPRQTRNILERIASPYANLDRPQALALEVTPNEDKVVAIGAAFTVSVRASSGRLTHPQLRQVDSANRETRHNMQSTAATVGSDAFSYRFDSVPESFQFRIQDGAALTRFYKIKAVARPTVQRLLVHCEYPSHTQLKSETLAVTDGRIVAPEGTRLRITAICDRAIARPTLQIDSEMKTGETDVSEKSPSYQWWVTLTAGDTLATIRLEDADGIESDPMVLKLRGITDKKGDSGSEKVAAQVDAFRGVLEKVRTDLEAVQPAAHDAADKGGELGQPSDQTRGEMQKVRDTAGAAAKQLKDAVRDFENTLLAPLVPAVKQTANEQLPGAEREIEQAATGDNPQSRQQAAKSAEGKIAKAIKQLDDVLGQLPKHTEGLNELAALEDLVAKQQKVVDDVNQHSQNPASSSPQEPAPWRQDESDVAKELKEMLDKDRKQGEKSGEKEGQDGDKPGDMSGMSSRPGDKPGDGMGEGEGEGMMPGMGTKPGKGGKPGPASSPPGALASAMQQAQQASTAPTAQQAQAPAANALSALSTLASAKAQGMGVPSISSAPAPGQPGSASPSAAPSPMGGKSASPFAGAVGPVDAKVTADRREWIIWREQASSNATQAANAEAPREFRDIVNQYFGELARRGVEGGEK